MSHARSAAPVAGCTDGHARLDRELPRAVVPLAELVGHLEDDAAVGRVARPASADGTSTIRVQRASPRSARSRRGSATLRRIGSSTARFQASILAMRSMSRRNRHRSSCAAGFVPISSTSTTADFGPALSHSSVTR